MQHWHVTVTLGGVATEPRLVEAALGRLSAERPFLKSCRGGATAAEICFWDQGDTMIEVASLALRLWNEHRESAALPHWGVIGLEVISQGVYEARTAGRTLLPLAIDLSH